MTDEPKATLELTKAEINHLGKCMASYEALTSLVESKALHEQVQEKLFEAEEQFEDDGE